LKGFRLIILATVIAASNSALSQAQDTTAPLYLFINGAGKVSPLTNGEFLTIGQSYNMSAIPCSGFAFSSWQPVDVFTFTNFVVDANGNTNAAVSVVPSPIPTFTSQPSLNFTMEPVEVVYDNPGVLTVTRSTGWQANFDPVVLSIQLGGAEMIVTWTNSSYTLQSAPMLVGPYTNISGALSPYTNNVSGPAQYFRLVSQ
jgi:hypothetical protein